MLVNLVTDLLQKVRVGDDHLKVGRTLGAQTQLGMYRGKKSDEDAKHLVTTELRESRGMTKMLGTTSTSTEPGVLVRPTA